jgi:two-component system, NtrC family, sensor histidine kinase HydH
MNQQGQSANQTISFEATIGELVHEIANPLTGMSASVEFLEQHLAENEGQLDGTMADIVQGLRVEIVRLHSLLDEFRCLSGPVLLDLQPVALARVVEELLVLEAWTYAKRGVHVVRDFPSGLPPAMADSHKLKQALLNLCKNAAEAMPKGGILTLRGYRSGNHICLDVADTGEGIQEGTPIFELFKTTKPSGTGIGLIVARRIVSAHGGTISYASERGQGTIFCVSLPLAL